MKAPFSFLAGGLALLGLSLWTSCGLDDGEAVSPNRIYPDLDLLYDASEDLTYARAAFLLDGPSGSLLALPEEASISLDGEALTFNRSLAIYELRRDGFRNSGTFVYTDGEGREFTNTVSLEPIEFQDSVPNIRAGEDYTLTWEGGSVGESETIFLSMILNDPIYDDRLWVQDTVGATQLTVPRDLVSLPSLPVRLILDRNRSNENVQAPPVGGSVSGNYRPVVAEVDIVQ